VAQWHAHPGGRSRAALIMSACDVGGIEKIRVFVGPAASGVFADAEEPAEDGGWELSAKVEEGSRAARQSANSK
jgi:hypothetical protein